MEENIFNNEFRDDLHFEKKIKVMYSLSVCFKNTY